MTYSKVESDPALSDESLMVRAQNNNQEAFALLVHRYERPLFNYLRRMTGNAADAEDLFQETFLRVHLHRQQFRRDAPFRPWLYRIATNLSVDRLRRRRRWWWFSLDAPAMQDPEGPTLGETLSDCTVAADEGARSHETARMLERAVTALPAKHRAVFLMARYDEMNYEDIARTLEIPVGTVKSRMNKAVQCLKDAMKDFL